MVALPDGWDSAAAANALRECNSFLDAALIDPSLTPIQMIVAETLRSVVRTHAERGDPVLWSDRAFLAEQFSGWRRFNAAPRLPRRKTA